MANYLTQHNQLEKEVSTDNKSEQKKSWLSGLKKGGLKPLVMVLILLVVAVVMYNFSGGLATSSSDKVDQGIKYTTSLDYIKQIELKLNDVVGNIKGAGNVKVMISISSSPQLEVAENVEEKTVTTSTGTTTLVTTEPIIVEVDGEDSPLILKETLPTINGVIVVSSGASDIRVRLDIISAVSTALGVNSNIVEVFVGE